MLVFAILRLQEEAKVEEEALRQEQQAAKAIHDAAEVKLHKARARDREREKGAKGLKHKVEKQGESAERTGEKQK